MDICTFHGANRFLSNFYPCEIQLGSLTFPSAEHAYQSCKTGVPRYKEHFTAKTLTASHAKRDGSWFPLRLDWEDVKVDSMRDILSIKFNLNSNKSLAMKLASTGGQRLLHGNDHRDQFWGTVAGQGQNILGKLLMDLRKDILLSTGVVDLE